MSKAIPNDVEGVDTKSGLPRSADFQSALDAALTNPPASSADLAPHDHTESRSETGAPSKKTRQRSTPPYNPGLQKLIEGKQTWFKPLDEDARAKGFLGWHQRGYLPHYDAPGVTQMVTLRLVDSFPASRRSEWEGLFLIENDRERRRRLENYLDLGFGECWLQRPAIARITEDALRNFDGQRYRLAAWAVMPNHVHVLVDIWETPLWQLIKSWKGFVARKANALLGRGGEFWQREYLETVIKDEDHLRKAIRYIENNPVKAKLIPGPNGWAWSSARFRDEFGGMTYLPRSADFQSALDTAPTNPPASSTNLAPHNHTESRSETGAPSA